MNRLEFATERLEDRKMLAGNVSVKLSGGDLIITGDNADNEVYVEINNDGQLQVAGENGTLINGEEEIVLDGTITDDLQINLKGGDDLLIIGQMSVADDVNVRLGSGNDRMANFGPMYTGDDFNIRGSSGNDVVLVEAEVEDDLRINTGSGDDFVKASQVFGGDLSISTGGGNDVAAVIASEFTQVRISLGGGSDYAFSHDVRADTARISGGGGDDLWLDCDDDPSSSDLFAVASSNSIDGSENSDIFTLLDDLEDQYGAS